MEFDKYTIERIYEKCDVDAKITMKELFEWLPNV